MTYDSQLKEFLPKCLKTVCLGANGLINIHFDDNSFVSLSPLHAAELSKSLNAELDEYDTAILKARGQ